MNIFVLISGYFLITTIQIKTKKILKLWLQIFTYAVFIFVTLVMLGIQPLRIKELIKNIFPITFTQWWFSSTYFVCYLITPYLNKLLNSLDKKEYQSMLFFLTLFWCIVPTFLTKKLESNGLLWFIYLYSLAGYIRLYVNKIKMKGRKYILAALVVMILTHLSAVIFDILGTRFSFFGNHVAYFYDMQRLPVVFISLCLFIGFIKIDIGYKKFINIISLATFGVYLIHDNVYLRSFIWENIFKNAYFFESPFFILYSIGVICFVFIVCTLIELVRIYVLEKHYIGLINKISVFIDSKKEEIFSLKIFDKI